jgi:hypothetical protein
MAGWLRNASRNLHQNKERYDKQERVVPFFILEMLGFEKLLGFVSEAPRELEVSAGWDETKRYPLVLL